MKRFDLEDRLIAYAVTIVKTVGQLSDSFSSSHLGKQLIRSSTSAALNYGEAQAAESRADFVHKLKIALKELKESQMCLKILHALESTEAHTIQKTIEETGELVAIFIVSIKTAKTNANAPHT